MSPRRWSRAVLGLALVLPAGFAIWWLSSHAERAQSRFDDALDAALAPVMEQREVHAKLGATTSAQARILARELALGSVRYLAAADLELWARTRERVARASPAACASLWKGGDDVAIGTAIAELGDDTLDSYVEMLSRGLALRLERKPPPALVPGAIERGFAAASASLPPDSRASFDADVKRPDIGDARACELFLAISHAAERLEPTQRIDFQRALAAQLKSTH